MLQFKLSDTQEEKLKTWQQTHACKYRKPGFGRYVGAFGGADTLLFTPLSMTKQADFGESIGVCLDRRRAQ